MNRKCENCKNAVQIVNPSIYKCKRDGTTKMYNDTCLYFKELTKDVNNDFITDFFNKEIFKDKK